MSEKTKPKIDKNEEPNQNPPRKRKLSTFNDKEEQLGPEGHSLLHSLKLGGEGDRIPVELLHASNEIKTEIKKGDALSEHNLDASSQMEDRSPEHHSPKGADKHDTEKQEGDFQTSEDSTINSSRSQRRSQRAIKRKKFDDEVVSTEPGVISATAAAATAGNISTSLPVSTETDEIAAPSGITIPAESTNAPPDATPQAHVDDDISTSSPQHKKVLQSISSLYASPIESNTNTNIGKNSPATTDGSPSTSVSVSTTSTKTTFDHAAALRSIGKGVGKNLRSRTASMNLSDAELAKIKKSKASANKKVKKPNKRDAAFKDLGRWKPTDDLALITSVLQTNDLHEVHRGIKFSCHFTYSEVQTRWQAVMFKSTISKLALQAIKNLHPEVVLSIQRRALLSTQERDLLGTIKSNTVPPPTLSDFNTLLSKHPTQFHHARTPRCLQHHWQGMKQYTLLPDQSVQPYVSRDNHILNFLDAEASITESIDSGLSSGASNTTAIATTNVSGQLAPDGHDLALFNNRDDALLDLELAAADRRAIKEIRHLEADIQKWQILVDKVRGDNPPDFDNQTLAVLRGRLVRYLMRSKEITLGRTAKGQKVDVDLKLEGPAWKISRRQGVIKLKNSGEFYIANEGKRSIFVDGKPIRRGCRVRLNNNSVLEIAGLKFVFLINQDLIEAIRQEANKMYQNS